MCSDHGIARGQGHRGSWGPHLELSLGAGDRLGCTHHTEGVTTSICTLGLHQGRHKKGLCQKQGKVVRSWQMSSNVALNTSTGKVCVQLTRVWQAELARTVLWGISSPRVPPQPLPFGRSSHQNPLKSTAPGMRFLFFAWNHGCETSLRCRKTEAGIWKGGLDKNFESVCILKLIKCQGMALPRSLAEDFLAQNIMKCKGKEMRKCEECDLSIVV